MVLPTTVQPPWWRGPELLRQLCNASGFGLDIQKEIAFGIFETERGFVLLGSGDGVCGGGWNGRVQGNGLRGICRFKQRPWPCRGS